MSHPGPHSASTGWVPGAAPQAGAEGTGNSPMARSSQSGNSYAKFWGTGGKCCCGCTADGHVGNVPNLWCCHPLTCVPASASVFRSSWMQRCSSSDARLRLAVKGCSFCGGHTPWVSGGMRRRRRRRRSARIELTGFKADEEGVRRWMGSCRQEHVRRSLTLLCSELSYSFPSPSPSCCFSRDVCETCKTQWGQRDTGKVRQWLMAL